MTIGITRYTILWRARYLCKQSYHVLRQL